jgi:hypothetical protein
MGRRGRFGGFGDIWLAALFPEPSLLSVPAVSSLIRPEKKLDRYLLTARELAVYGIGLVTGHYRWKAWKPDRTYL